MGALSHLLSFSHVKAFQRNTKDEITEHWNRFGRSRNPRWFCFSFQKFRRQIWLGQCRKCLYTNTHFSLEAMLTSALGLRRDETSHSVSEVGGCLCGSAGFIPRPQSSTDRWEDKGEKHIFSTHSTMLSFQKPVFAFVSVCVCVWTELKTLIRDRKWTWCLLSVVAMFNAHSRYWELCDTFFKEGMLGGELAVLTMRLGFSFISSLCSVYADLKPLACLFCWANTRDVQSSKKKQARSNFLEYFINTVSSWLNWLKRSRAEADQVVVVQVNGVLVPLSSWCRQVESPVGSTLLD